MNELLAKTTRRVTFTNNGHIESRPVGTEVFVRIVRGQIEMRVCGTLLTQIGVSESSFIPS